MLPGGEVLPRVCAKSLSGYPTGQAGSSGVGEGGGGGQWACSGHLTAGRVVITIFFRQCDGYTTHFCVLGR